jgi:hypothetical protein
VSYSDPPDLPGCFFAWIFGKYRPISLHITSNASKSGLGLVTANVRVKVRVRPDLGTLQASGQIRPQS